MLAAAGIPSSWTGLAFGDGGIPSFSFGGCRGLLLELLGEVLFLLWPGTGGFSRGTGEGDEDDIARAFCLSPGKNNSFGSASVARLASLELECGKEVDDGGERFREGRRNKDRGAVVRGCQDERMMETKKSTPIQTNER